jgi:hypothetical protein
MSEHHRTASWQRVLRVMKPRLAAEIEQGYGACIDCRGYIPPGTPLTHWQVGHRVSVAKARAMGWDDQQIDAYDNLGPSHSKASGRACNQIAGGKDSQAKARATKTTNKRHFTY